MVIEKGKLTRAAAKSAASGLLVLALAAPAGGAFAASASSADVKAVSASAASAAASSATAYEADPAKVVFTKAQAIAKLRALFPALEKAEVTNATLGITNSYPAPANQMIWDIQWSYQEGNRGYGFSSQVDALNGDLISTYLYMGETKNESYYPPEVTREEALEKAKAFIAKAAPSISLADLEVSDNNYYYMGTPSLFGPVQYGFNFSLKKNGVLSAVENVSVTVDGVGSVISFNKSSEHWVYPSGKAAISPEQAEKAFKDAFDVELVYLPVYGNSPSNRWILGWRPTERSLYSVDAASGGRLNPYGTVSKVTQAVYSDVPSLSPRFTPRTSSEELTQSQAVEAVRKAVSIPASQKLASSSLNENYGGTLRKVWNLFWNPGAADNGVITQAYASVDAETGQVISYTTSPYPFPDTSAKANAASASGISLEKARAKALALINLLYPDASKQLKLIEPQTPAGTGGGFGFQFLRYHNGIPVGDGGITVSLDKDGNLQSYMVPQTTEIDDTKLSLSDLKVTKEEALSQYLGKYQVKLQYQSYGGYAYYGYTEPFIKLVYAPVGDFFNTFGVLDAATGKFTAQYTSYSASPSSPPAADIEGLPAEKALAALVQYNVLVPDADGKVKPDAQLTAGEWVTWMAKALNPNYSNYYSAGERKPVASVDPESPYYDAVAFAVNNGWIEPESSFQPDAPLTREQFAVLLTSIVGYDKIAAYLADDAAVTRFSDVLSISRKGEVAVAVKLGLLAGSDGTFNPSGTVTRAEAAQVMMKLVELQGKTDQIIGQSRYY